MKKKLLLFTVALVLAENLSAQETSIEVGLLSEDI